VKPLVPRQTCHPSRPWALKFPSRKFILWVTRRRYSTKYSSALVTSARLFIFRQDVRHTLPPEVNHMNEATQIALAMQVEERNCLQTELDLAARRSRYHTFTSHHHSLTVDTSAKPGQSVQSGQSGQSWTVVHRTTEVTEGCRAVQLCTAPCKICPALCRSAIVCRPLYRTA
jgi:hypothetical protein